MKKYDIRYLPVAEEDLNDYPEIRSYEGRATEYQMGQPDCN